MSTHDQKSVPAWQRWFKAFDTEPVSVVPAGAKSHTLRAKAIGKTPGFQIEDGTWVGATGPRSEQRMTLEQMKIAHRTGAAIGMFGRKFPGLDVDTELRALAVEAEELAQRMLGPAPRRGREGSARRLLMYRGEKHRHRRLEFRPPGWKEGDKLDAIEWLGAGQYYNVEGVHPSGQPYAWTDPHPCDLGPQCLSEVTVELVDAFFAALPALLERHGCVVSAGRAIPSGTAAGSSGSRRPLDDPTLHGPSPELVIEVLAAWPNEGTTLPSHLDFVRAMAAIKAALGPRREEFYGDVEAWALGYSGNDDTYVRERWDSLNDSELGWSWLTSMSGWSTADDDFDEHLDGGGEDLPPAPEGVAAKNALKHMFSTSVYVRSINMFGNLEISELEDREAFCQRHRGVAKVGRSGIASAASIFRNHPRARIVDVVTYRPNQGLICEEIVDGVARTAFNTYRPSALQPTRSVTDADIEPWLGLWTKMFGARGTPDCEHVLNWKAFVLQRPGEKINHALIIVDPTGGIGKDSLFEPLRRGVGERNVSTIDAEDIFEPFNADFLPTQLLILNEVHSFRTREKMNKLKRYVAAPPHTLTVNEKFVRRYEVPNIVNVLGMSNEEEDALAPMKGDRRYAIFKSLLEEQPTDEFFIRYWRWLNDGGDAKVVGWLKARDIRAFNPHAPAPMTEAKQVMIAATQPVPLRWCREQLGEHGALESREIITAMDIVQAADRSKSNAARNVNPKWALAALKAEGFTGLKQIRDGKDRWRLWTRKALTAQLGPEELVKRYREEAGLWAAPAKGADTAARFEEEASSPTPLRSIEW